MISPSPDELRERLGLDLRDPDTVRLALIHSSYFNENAALAPGHNERLEFLGDAVIGLVVSRLLYERFPDEDEGLLTARRAALVNRESLAEIARELGLDRLMLLGRGEADAGGAGRPSLLAAALEAVAGAIYLTEGLDVGDAWLRAILLPRLEPQAGGREPPKSAKSRFQEWSQRNRQQRPRYELLSSTGPPHAQHFRVAAVLANRQLGIGEGSSRQRAEEQAAAAALRAVEQPAKSRSART